MSSSCMRPCALSALSGGLLAWSYRDGHRELMPWVLLIFSGVSAFFLSVMAFASNPFEQVFPVPPDGRGLNPLLEDANMLTHPPLLYTGFVGLTVPYAFAMAALITGKLDEAWILTTRRWTVVAWFFLTLGNLVGAWWSYHVLGWGGYWAWDPVENAAFMPWLPATAFLHSIQIQERRRMLKTWNLCLIIIAFSLTIFGTFLTRSGILSSIHAFSNGPVAMLFLAFLALVLLGSFGLLARRRFLTLLAVIGPILALLALLGYGLTRNPREIPTPLLGKPAAPFTLTLFDGRQLSLEELRGKVVFLNFWASWCPPCRAEARTLEAAWQKYQAQEVVFRGVNIQDREEAARAFLQEFGITYPNSLDGAGKIAIAYGVWGLPETFIIDREGRITYKHIGALGWTTITTKLDEALRGMISAEEGKGEYRPVR